MPSYNRSAIPESLSFDLTTAMECSVLLQTPRPLIAPRPSVTTTAFPSLSLDLGDIRKTQRRVATLLNVRGPKGGLGPPVSRWKRSKICPICKKMDNPSQEAHVHSYDESERLDDGTSERLINNYIPKDFNGIVIPSMWDGRQATDEDVQSYIRDRTLSSGADRSEQTIRLPSIGGQWSPGTNYSGSIRPKDAKVLRSFEKDRETSSSGVLERNHITLSDEISKLGRRGTKSTTIFTDMSGLGPWIEEEGEEGGLDTEDEDEDEDEVDEDVFMQKNKTKQEEYGRSVDENWDSRIQNPERDVHVFTENNSAAASETGSRETSHLHADSNSRLESGKWCECVQIDSSRVECRECFIKGGHERWCRSQTGECPECGRPIKGIFRNRTRSTRSLLKSPSKTRTDLSSSSHRSGMCSAHHGQTSEKTETSTSVSVSKKEKKKKKKEKKLNKRNQKEPNATVETKPVKQTYVSKRYCRVIPGVNPSLPSFDPNIHRDAYLLALSDARVKKWRNDPWMFQDLPRSHYFSYFSLWKNPKPNSEPATETESKSGSEPVPKIGIRGKEEKLKIKDPMKHIFGSLKLSEYYPSGKRFPRISEEATSKSEWSAGLAD